MTRRAKARRAKARHYATLTDEQKMEYLLLDWEQKERYWQVIAAERRR